MSTLARISALISRPAVAYTLLALFQLKVLWGDWQHRDLVTGDNLVYVAGAYRWAEHGTVDLVWSPLYGVFYGTIFMVVGDMASATWLQRALVTFAVTLLVLAALRALLPASIAWLVAAWWALLESTFNVTVEVHLFAMLPLLLAIVLVTRLPGRWGRSLALAVLLAAAMLVRNEYTATALLFGAFCAWSEVHEWRRGVARPAVYLAPMLVVGLIFAWFDSRAEVPLSQLLRPPSYLSWKHTANVCQAYAASYVQRHTDWSGNVIVGCHTLMERDFGFSDPTLVHSPTFVQATMANPGAILEHMLWNLSIAGNGLQVGLFGAMSGTTSPDFTPVKQDMMVVPILTAALIGLLLVGAGLFASSRGRCAPVARGSKMGWVVLLVSAGTTGLVIAAVRPRPEYIYPLTLLVMAAAGGSLALVASLLPWRHWLTPGLGVVAIVAALVAVPGFYADPAHVRPRSTLVRYETLRPYTALIRDPNSVFLMGDFAAGLAAYFGRPLASWGTVYRYEEIIEAYDGQVPFDSFLADRKITLAFLDQRMLTRLQQYDAARRLLNDPGSVGWRLVGLNAEGPSPWMLFRREKDIRAA